MMQQRMRENSSVRVYVPALIINEKGWKENTKILFFPVS